MPCGGLGETRTSSEGQNANLFRHCGRNSVLLEGEENMSDDLDAQQRSDAEGNLVANPEFQDGDSSAHGWCFVAPRDEIAPAHEIREMADGTRRLVLRATGDRRTIGCWQGEAELETGKWYRASVRVALKGIVNPGLALFPQVAQRFLVPREPWSKQTEMEQVFCHDHAQRGSKVELYLLAAEQGEVEYFDPRVVEIPKPDHRMARVATVRFGASDGPLTVSGQRDRIADKLDFAGALRPDIVALPEFSPVVGVPQQEYGSYLDVAEEVPDGPVCRILSAKASEYGMYVLAGVIERRAPYLFNTAVIFGRDGELVGRYVKTHLTFGELEGGISCGDEFPVFDLDFGRIGIHICYDEWFPEVARYYAHQGTEILFLPVAGGKPITWRTRALDNGIYFVSSSITPPSMIIGSSGAIIAETHGDGVAVADLDLDWRETNVYVDPTLAQGMPCIVPQMRHVLDHSLLDQLHKSLRDAWR